MAARRDQLSNPWCGVSLGGWLLLEPGPSYPLFTHHPAPDGNEARCEWDLMKIMRQQLGKKRAAEVMKIHRDTHITKADFQRIRACGLNAVRLPFGYWVVAPPKASEPYFGPAIEYIDRAVDWAEECGLQVVLDLHGCPGSESPEAPCGRRQRPATKWNWKHWDFDKSLDILEMLAKRYSSRSCVTGVAVCNEPSGEVPATALLRYYSRAVDRIRKAGMPASDVAVVLPVFQRSEGEDRFIKKWWSLTKGRHRNVCFDVHCYNCFESEFNGKTFAQQLRAVDDNAEMLRRHPMVVGEWSLALGVATWCTAGNMEEDNVWGIFGAQQIKAFKEASHGSFFWTWKEAPDNKEWNFQLAFGEGLLSRLPRELPTWNGAGEDPLEDLLHPPPHEPTVYYGDAVYLRVFYGRYLEVQGSQVNASYADKGLWQEVRFIPSKGKLTTEAVRNGGRQEVRHLDQVRLRTHNGRFLGVEGETITAMRSSTSPAGEFEVHLQGAERLSHRSNIFFKSTATKMLLDADEEQDGIFARYTDFGNWQSFAVEKVEDLKPVGEDVKLWGCGEENATSTPLRVRTASKDPKSQTKATPKAKISSKALGSPKNLKRKASDETATLPKNSKAKSVHVR
eukprot:TRINITY_DN9952_c0_g6_i1.p1 TRINITY_DN9952_c0_g6~~TRINITY_DN9952_c0_g6_i1.p1  ORF type:complete len:637 (+),score=108.86 TRINITY_DN9952_c0_g6_i1:51-1913(+)